MSIGGLWIELDNKRIIKEQASSISRRYWGRMADGGSGEARTTSDNAIIQGGGRGRKSLLLLPSFLSPSFSLPFPPRFACFWPLFEKALKVNFY